MKDENSLKYLIKNADDDWHFHKPHLLYQEGEQADAYLQAMKNPEYSDSFHSETVKIIAENKDKIFGISPEISLIDLGPGYPDKALAAAKWLNENSSLDYYPVDVSQMYLDIAVDAMRPHCRFIRPIHPVEIDLVI